MEIDERTFRKALGCFATGVTVLTTRAGKGHKDEGKLIGVTVSAFSSLSLDPPLVLFCLDKRNTSLDVFRSSPFVVNILREDQRQLSIQFASKSEEKWQGIKYDLNDKGVPMIRDSLAYLECLPHEALDGGDHLIVIGRVSRLEYQTGGQPLLYFRGTYASLGEGC